MKQFIIIAVAVLVIVSGLVLPCFAETYMPDGANWDYLSQTSKPIWGINDVVWRDGDSAFLFEYPATFITGYAPNVDISIVTGANHESFVYKWGNASDPDYTMWRTHVNDSEVDFSLYGSNFPIFEVNAVELYRDEIRVVNPRGNGSLTATWAMRYMYVNTGEYHVATLQDSETISFTAGTVSGVRLCPPSIRGALGYDIMVLDYTLDVEIDSQGEYELQFWNRTASPTEISHATETFLQYEITDAWDDFDITAFFDPVADVLQIPIFGHFTLGGVLTVVVAFSLVMLLLKFFAGG